VPVLHRVAALGQRRVREARAVLRLGTTAVGADPESALADALVHDGEHPRTGPDSQPAVAGFPVPILRRVLDLEPRTVGHPRVGDRLTAIDLSLRVDVRCEAGRSNELRVRDLVTPTTRAEGH